MKLPSVTGQPDANKSDDRRKLDELVMPGGYWVTGSPVVLLIGKCCKGLEDLSNVLNDTRIAASIAR